MITTARERKQFANMRRTIQIYRINAKSLAPSHSRNLEWRRRAKVALHRAHLVTLNRSRTRMFRLREALENLARLEHSGDWYYSWDLENKKLIFGDGDANQA